jgi:shikimate dehydrogenase
MKRYGLLGYPLSHSFSKKYFTEKFERDAVDAVYDLYPLPDIRELVALIDATPDLAGLNVTIPYKQSVMPFLDALDPEAEAIGAVNVIRFERPHPHQKPILTGFNTDVYGFRESIRPLLESLKARLLEEEDYAPIKALVFGTGGASKAILYGLKQLGIEPLLVSRHEGNGQITYQQLTPGYYNECRVLVNTTPLGMYPKVDACPDIDYTRLGEGHLLFDAVYNPEKTLFLQKGEAQGALVQNGLEMLHLQAEAAWAVWSRP